MAERVLDVEPVREHLARSRLRLVPPTSRLYPEPPWWVQKQLMFLGLGVAGGILRCPSMPRPPAYIRIYPHLGFSRYFLIFLLLLLLSLSGPNRVIFQ